MKPMTCKDFEKGIEMLRENANQPEREKIIQYTSENIKLGLKHDYFDDIGGIVKLGGIRVFDLTKGEFAMTKDYI